MIDITSTLSGKNSQLNADDLDEKGRHIKITGVRMTDGEQPLTINYENDLGRPFLPCLTMRRVLAHIWGVNAEQYVGRILHVYRDPDVSWAGQKVGGVRIKGASDISAAVTYTATTGRGKRKSVIIQPLARGSRPTSGQQNGESDGLQEQTQRLIAAVRNTSDLEALENLTRNNRVIALRKQLRDNAPDLARNVEKTVEDRLAQLAAEPF